MAELQAAQASSQTELAQTFHSAQQAEQPLEQPSQSVPEKTELASTFDQAASGLEPDDPPPADQGRGSEMVEQDQPQPEPRPTPEMAEAVDREHFNDAWTQEQQNAAAASNAANDRVAEIAAELENAQGQAAQAEQNMQQGPGMG